MIVKGGFVHVAFALIKRITINIEVQVLRARLYRARRYIRKKYGEEYQEL